MVPNFKFVLDNVYQTGRVPKCSEFLNSFFEHFALCGASFMRCLGGVMALVGVMSIRCPVSLYFGMILE